MIQQKLFLEVEKANWCPANPPDLRSINPIYIDTETTGLRWWGGDLPIGIAAAVPGKSWYLPFAHAGGNLSESAIKTWTIDNLRGKDVFFFNAPFDLGMLYAWGIDLEALGCRVHDIGHAAALLNDSRRTAGLDSIAKEYLDKGKIEGIDSRRIQAYHAADAEDYAKRDAELLVQLHEKFWPLLEKEDLHRVRELEDNLIFVTCEMMRNGAPLDLEKLELWNEQAQHDIINTHWELHKLTGIRVDVNSRPSLINLWRHLRVMPPMRDGKICFDKSLIRNFLQNPLEPKAHQAIKLVFKARSLGNLHSKFLAPYLKDIKRNGILRYALHQMRIDTDGGTISGRYSSSAFSTGDGVNIQQPPGKQHYNLSKDVEGLEKYIIRELIIPESGLWLSADADQIEYRIFAHYAKPPGVLKAYRKNPRTDFHNLVLEMVQKIKPDATRVLTKNLNFAKIYGAGPYKIAMMLGLEVNEAMPFINAYDRAFPEASRLLNKASKLAQTRGWVRTLLGRRARFNSDKGLHAALNRVIQGTAADEMKLKLLELYRTRKETGFKMRFTVHDEVDGDIPDIQSAEKVKEILNQQILDTEVPLFWSVSTGKNWGKCTWGEK